jgi:RNA polymerase sigma-70 factor (ECF subfamily)
LAEEKTDLDLIQEAASGGRQAFEKLVEKYYGRVYGVSYRYLMNAQDAEDVTQEVFARAYAAAGDFVPRGSVYGWLMRITVNLCLTELKVRARRPVEPLDDARVDGSDGAREIDRREVRRQVESALSALPDDQRMAVILAKYEGFSYDEIARAMDRSIASVESLLVRARRELARRLEPYVTSH